VDVWLHARDLTQGGQGRETALLLIGYASQHLARASSEALMCTCRRKLPAARAPRAPSLKRGPFCSTLAEPTRVESLDNACPVLVILDDAPEVPLMLHVEKYRILARPRKCINRQLCSSCWQSTANQRMNQVAIKLPKSCTTLYSDAIRERSCV